MYTLRVNGFRCLHRKSSTPLSLSADAGRWGLRKDARSTWSMSHNQSIIDSKCLNLLFEWLRKTRLLADLRRLQCPRALHTVHVQWGWWGVNGNENCCLTALQFWLIYTTFPPLSNSKTADLLTATHFLKLLIVPNEYQTDNFPRVHPVFIYIFELFTNFSVLKE